MPCALTLTTLTKNQHLALDSHADLSSPHFSNFPPLLFFFLFKQKMVSFKPSAAAFFLAANSCVSAQTTHRINVGQGGQNVYDPPNTVAATGDLLEFHFYPSNHTVTEASFGAPCRPIGGAFFSGFVDTTDEDGTTTFTHVLLDERPLFFYCSQGNHCQAGMVGSINAQNGGNTLEAFRDAAASAQRSTAPTRVAGGNVNVNVSNSRPPPTSTTSSRAAGAMATAPVAFVGGAILALAAFT